MIDCMGKYYLKQMVYLVLYIKEHICVLKTMSLKVDFNNCRERIKFQLLTFLAEQ